MAINESIRTIDLSDNNLGPSQSSLIVKLLQGQTECKDNKVWSAGLWGEFPEDLDSIGLKSLILFKNNLSDQFLFSLSSWMKYDEYMRHIDLWYNDFHEWGLWELFDSLRQNKGLISIEIKGNPGFWTKLHQLYALELLNKLD